MSELQPEVELIISATAAATAKQIVAKLKKEHEKELESQFDKRLFNTRLLLEHYRMFKEHADNAVFELTRLDEEDLTAIEIMDSMWQSSTMGKRELALESIKNSALRTRIVVKHIEDMLGIYESYCYRSGKPENERRWEVINALYIQPIPEGMSKTELLKELSEKHFTSVRQLQYDVKEAIERITALMFGIDGIRRLDSRKNSKKE